MAEDGSARRTVALLVVLGLVWGSAYPVIRYGLLAGATPLAFALVRYALSAAAIAILAAATRVARPAPRALAMSALLGLPIVGLYGLFLYVGEQWTSGGVAAILIGGVPFLTALFALPLLPGESLGRAGVLGLAIGFVGVVVLVFPPGGVVLATTIWGPIAVFAAAVSVAGGTVLLRRQRPEGETLWGLTVQFAAATIFLAAMLPLFERHPALPTTTPALLALAYLVALPSVVGYTLYFYLHHRVGPGRANVVAYVNPLAAVSIGTLLLGEPFQLWELAGFALIVIGLTILTRYGKPAP
ncbi:MAG: EamA family transporter [Thermoplasmata archaeon]|nr:EamA family transporter [Thermoplasmata archaeon]MCI4356553.1 EamA family transporter [Thermoplasmata archaeon]